MISQAGFVLLAMMILSHYQKRSLSTFACSNKFRDLLLSFIKGSLAEILQKFLIYFCNIITRIANNKVRKKRKQYNTRIANNKVRKKRKNTTVKKKPALISGLSLTTVFELFINFTMISQAGFVLLAMMILSHYQKRSLSTFACSNKFRDLLLSFIKGSLAEIL